MKESKWFYIQSEPQVFTVGFYAPDDTWHTDSDWGNRTDASKRVHYLNGCNLSFEEKVQEVTHESNKAF